MCLEGVLIPDDNREYIGARLKEAVAHSLGKTREEKDTYRKLVGELYNARSKWVHTGRLDPNVGGRGKRRKTSLLDLERESIELARRILKKEVEALPLER
jgi:hypothetical protein